jgi:hypothetical protein
MSLKRFVGYTRFAIGLGVVWLWMQPMVLAQSARLSAEQVLEQIFRTDTPLPGSTEAKHQNLPGGLIRWRPHGKLPGSTEAKHQNLLRIRSQVFEWLGSYQGVRAENGRSVILFERGSIPVRVIFRKNGEPDRIDASECPTTSVPIVQAPSEYRQALSECPRLTP